MPAELLRCVEVEPNRPAEACVVLLHGLGADGHDFEPIVPEVAVGRLALRWVFPHAPAIAVTLNGGMRMPAWYDIVDLDLRSRHDQSGVNRSGEQVARLLEREVERGIPAERIVLAGFSQGGAIALWLGLRYPRRLAGIIALSTYLIAADRLEFERSEANRATPIFQAHGLHDPMVHIERGRDCRDRLIASGQPVEWREYPMQHAVCLEEIEDVGEFLRGVLGAGIERSE